MLKLHFASLSMGASVDQQTGHLSVFDVLEELRVPRLPIHMQSLVISLSLQKTQQGAFDGKIFIHFLTPQGEQQMVGTGELSVPADQPRIKAVFRFGGFPIAGFGAHRFVVSWVNSGGTKIGEALLDFNVSQVTEVAQGVAPSEKPVSH